MKPHSSGGSIPALEKDPDVITVRISDGSVSLPCGHSHEDKNEEALFAWMGRHQTSCEVLRALFAQIDERTADQTDRVGWGGPYVRHH
jgi:hypothetical protein